MNGAGRTVRLFLVDGSPTGLITAEIMNWTGHVLVGPRGRLAEVLKRPEAGRTGVYFLVGDDPETPSKSRIYVGEGDDVGKRIAQHNKDDTKDFWTRLCLVTSKDQNLTKAHGRYLESRLIQIAASADRAILANSTSPDSAGLPESDVADMEYFLAQIGLVLPVLGFEFLRQKPGRQETLASVSAEPTGKPNRPIRERVEQANSEAPLELVLQDNKSNLTAHAYEADGEFVVLKGSGARKGANEKNPYAGLRDQLIKDGRLAPDGNSAAMRFVDDVPFKSPSAAAAVVLDRSSNGRSEWLVKGTRKTLASWQETQLAKSAADQLS